VRGDQHRRDTGTAALQGRVALWMPVRGTRGRRRGDADGDTRQDTVRPASPDRRGGAGAHTARCILVHRARGLGAVQVWARCRSGRGAGLGAVQVWARP